MGSIELFFFLWSLINMSLSWAIRLKILGIMMNPKAIYPIILPVFYFQKNIK